MGAFISIFHTLNLPVFLFLTQKHTLIFQDVTLGIKPSAWFYSAAEPSCRWSFPGSQSGSDMDTHSHARRHKYISTHFCIPSSTYKLCFSLSLQTDTLTDSFQQIYPCLLIAQLWHIPQSYCTSDCYGWMRLFLPQASAHWGLCQQFCVCRVDIEPDPTWHLQFFSLNL